MVPAALIFIAPAAAAPGVPDDQVAIVASLYKSFAWQVLSSSIGVFGKPLTQQKSSVLRHYFDQDLASLLVKDGHCAAKTGEPCNLDFDPIFASQDPAAIDLTIHFMPKDIVAVEFTYPASGENVRLEYRMIRKENGWRIDDIRYPGMSDASLKQVLARKLPGSDR